MNLLIKIDFKIDSFCGSQAEKKDLIVERASELKETCLHKFHVNKGGKMVPFAGFSMPVQYSDLGITASHIHTRKHMSIFDVSHMLQTKIYGKDRVQFIESLVVADVKALPENMGTLSLFTTDKGGIIDDLIVNNTDAGYLFIVSNAGCMDKDLEHMKGNLQEFKSKGGDAELEVITDRALIALQGPGMTRVLQPLVTCNLENLKFMNTCETTLCGISGCRVSRCGYTGEDGVEISLPNSKAEEVVETLLNSKEDKVELAGLAARDSLRLEAGLCLYGNDIDETTTPVEASLSWTIGKRRKQEKNFPGAEIIMRQLKEKPARRRVGIISSGPPARGETKIVDLNTKESIGVLTSGCPSPCLPNNVAMGYIKSAFAKAGTDIGLEIRKKIINAKVTKMPFVPTKYFTGTK
ncbi:Aminomethyltransferase, mitochondrial [Nymphon striatum]|nr:Aminomethyltransferase, mitochondrial [Nymphon striatum]